MSVVIAEGGSPVNAGLGRTCGARVALHPRPVLFDCASRACPWILSLPQPATTAYLLLDVAGVACALPRAEVREILPLPNLHRPPAGTNLLAGFLNLGGAPLPVIDLARLLGLRDALAADAIRDPYRHLVVAADGAAAFLVDRVADLIPVDASAIRPVAGDETLNGCVAAEIVQGERLVHALAIARLLTQAERERIGVLTRAAGERLAALGEASAA